MSTSRHEIMISQGVRYVNLILRETAYAPTIISGKWTHGDNYIDKPRSVTFTSASSEHCYWQLVGAGSAGVIQIGTVFARGSHKQGESTTYDFLINLFGVKRLADGKLKASGPGDEAKCILTYQVSTHFSAGPAAWSVNAYSH